MEQNDGKSKNTSAGAYAAAKEVAAKMVGPKPCLQRGWSGCRYTDALQLLDVRESTEVFWRTHSTGAAPDAKFRGIARLSATRNPARKGGVFSFIASTIF
jgi:hypothetical protein